MNNTATNTFQPISIDQLARMGLSADKATFHDPAYNATICSVMTERRLYKQDVGGCSRLDFDAPPDWELSDLLQFQWANASAEGVTSGAFMTPCMANISAAEVAALISRRIALCLVAGDHCWLVQGPGQALTMTVVLPDSRRRSPSGCDVVLGSVDASALKVAALVVTTTCVAPPRIALLAGECKECPEGAHCPGPSGPLRR